jgi:type I restriction enzyme S subunit
LTKSDFVSSGIPVLTIGCLTDHGLELTKAMFVQEKTAQELERYRLREGDFLFSRMASVGRASIVPSSLQGALFNYHIMRLRLSRKAYEPSLFLAYVRGAPSTKAYLESVNHGGTRDGINTAQLLKMPIAVPPAAEQRRIVSKLESLLTRSRRAKEALDAIPALLERFRQSVLAAAFRGDLTADWRAQHPDVEPASQLLQQIQAEHRKSWEESELEKMRSRGKTPRDDSWKAKYEKPETVNASTLPDLPAGWCWASLDELLASLRNGIASKPDQNAGLPILRISAVRPLSLDLEDVRYLPVTQEYDDYALRNGDLLFTRYNGNAELVGACAVVRNCDRTTVYPDKLIRGRVVASIATPDYIELALATGAASSFISEKRKTAAGQVGISGSDLRRVPVPIAPLKEQHALVSIAHRLLRSQSVIAEQARRSATQLEQMNQTVLAKAFRGELVPQDPNDEPASVLLERLRAEREASDGSTPKRSRGRRPAA